MKRTTSSKSTPKIVKIIIIILLVSGAGFILYPVICNTYNQYKNDKAIEKYDDMTEKLSERESRRMLAAAREYNRKHKSNIITDSFGKKKEFRLSEGYRKLLDPSGTGAMGYIEIPKINVRLVIYHGTDEKVLETGCGHVEGTSLPVGGRNTHCVLSAHRGLPSAKLFTDLDKLKKGDHFNIFVLNEILAYKVDRITVVKPDELGAIQNNTGDDRVTLLTCTPYGVNSHRLLVSGQRTDYTGDAEKHPGLIRCLVLAILIVTVLLITAVIIVRKRKSRS